ncbi:hypothetical protein [Microbacterium sp. CIAB417]|uniref:hypothetical protein n=1 Tax=Microbacterium sp. CIAB417 TaxID=2860287 RepID=UPI001FACE8EB|nr:hypothetical protein [Microbacterium sp. CIAB417]
MDPHIFRPQAVSDAEEGIVSIPIDITAWLDAAAISRQSSDASSSSARSNNALT